MYLRTFSHCRWTRNLHFSRSSAKTIYDCDLNGSPLLQRFIGSKEREVLTFGLPGRFYIKSEDFNVDGYSSCEIEMLGYLYSKNSPVVRKDSSTMTSFKLQTNDENGSIHRLKEISGKDRMQKIGDGDLVLTKGHLAINLNVMPETSVSNNGKYFYTPPIVVMEVFKMGRHRSCNTFSNATLFGKVLGNYFPFTEHSKDYVGQLTLLTWLNSFGDERTEIHLQINRIFIGKTTLGLFPFITQLEEGDHLMVTGSLDYFRHPIVDSKVPAIRAKHMIRVEKLYQKREVA